MGIRAPGTDAGLRIVRLGGVVGSTTLAGAAIIRLVCGASAFFSPFGDPSTDLLEAFPIKFEGVRPDEKIVKPGVVHEPPKVGPVNHSFGSKNHISGP